MADRVPNQRQGLFVKTVYSSLKSSSTFASYFERFPIVFETESVAKDLLNVDALSKDIQKEFPNVRKVEATEFFGYCLFEMEDCVFFIASTDGDDIHSYDEEETTKSWTAYTLTNSSKESWKSLEKLDTLLKKHIFPDRESINIHFYYQSPDGISSEKYRKKNTDYEYVKQEFFTGIDASKLVKAYREAKENIMIFIGDPGVGKTTFLKFMMRELNHHAPGIKVAYCKDAKIAKDNSFWIMLKNGKYDLLLLDDFDNSIAPRKKQDGTDNFVSHLLSASDGIFDDKMKVLITTNQELSEIDSALLRRGRCFDIIQMRHLTIPEAKKIWTKIFKLDEKSFDDKFENMTSVQQAILAMEADILLRKIDRSYITDKTVSKLEDFNERSKKKHIGFEARP